MPRSPLMACALLACALFLSASADEGWVTGRSTWFDVGPDMSTANCHYSWVPTGRFVGAFSDAMEGFSSSCGKCYEVRCRNGVITDGYGATLDRANSCYDESKSVVITIADACPCRYPNNDYSNKRWCCGDMNHIDISQEAFQELADLSIGVIGLTYREVDCGTTGNPGTGSSTPSNVNTNNESSNNNPVQDAGFQTYTGSSDQPQQEQTQQEQTQTQTQTQTTAPKWSGWASGKWGGRWGL